MKRKIAAILAADMVGYSRLVAEDEEETLRRLGSYGRVFEDFVARHGGRIFKTAGDSVLAEFSSAVDAVRCAVELQESLRTHNLAYSSSRQMHYRIGVTIGDVIERDGDLLGDGVNIAARLEGLAKPGGICVSRSVFEQVSNKLTMRFDDIGEQLVKNIPTPVHAYVAAPPDATNSKANFLSLHVAPRNVIIVAATAFSVVTLGLSALHLVNSPQSKAPTEPDKMQTSLKAAAAVQTGSAERKETAASQEKEKQLPSAAGAPLADEPVVTTKQAESSEHGCVQFVPQSGMTIKVPCTDAPSSDAQPAPPSNKGSEIDYMTADELISTFRGNTSEGTMVNSGRYTEYYAPSGQIRGKNFRGKWWVNDDTLCVSYPGFKDQCYRVRKLGLPNITCEIGGWVAGTGRVVPGNVHRF